MCLCVCGRGGVGGDSKSPLSALDNVRDFETVLFLASSL